MCQMQPPPLIPPLHLLPLWPLHLPLPPLFLSPLLLHLWLSTPLTLLLTWRLLLVQSLAGCLQSWWGPYHLRIRSGFHLLCGRTSGCALTWSCGMIHRSQRSFIIRPPLQTVFSHTGFSCGCHTTFGRSGCPVLCVENSSQVMEPTREPARFWMWIGTTWWSRKLSGAVQLVVKPVTFPAARPSWTSWIWHTEWSSDWSWHEGEYTEII